VNVQKFNLPKSQINKEGDERIFFIFFSLYTTKIIGLKIFQILFASLQLNNKNKTSFFGKKNLRNIRPLQPPPQVTPICSIKISSISTFMSDKVPFHPNGNCYAIGTSHDLDHYRV